MSEPGFSVDEIEIGHTFSPLIYPIDEQLIRKYVDAVGDNDPLHRDVSHAQSRGYENIVAPPTIAALYVLKAYRTDGAPPRGGVHVRQHFRFYRPTLAGDIFRVQATVTDKFVKKGRKFLVIESLARNQRGQLVVWSESTSFWSE